MSSIVLESFGEATACNITPTFCSGTAPCLRDALRQRLHGRPIHRGEAVQARRQNANYTLPRAEHRVRWANPEVEQHLAEAPVRSVLLFDRERQLLRRDEVAFEQNLAEGGRRP